jgi:hypothetical protein
MENDTDNKQERKTTLFSYAIFFITLGYFFFAPRLKLLYSQYNHQIKSNALNPPPNIRGSLNDDQLRVEKADLMKGKEFSEHQKELKKALSELKIKKGIVKMIESDSPEQAKMNNNYFKKTTGH